MSAHRTPFTVEVAVEPKTAADQERLGVALAEMVAEDPSFAAHADPESGQVRLRGVDESHLGSKVDALRRIYGVEANVGAPQVAYRETLGRAAEIDYSHSALTADGGAFARVKLRFEPGESGSGLVAQSLAANAPLAFVRGVLDGIDQAAANGLLAGFPVADFRVVLTEMVCHGLDSSEAAFRTAARRAFRELREKGAPTLLEPIMKVEVLTPDEYMGDVIGDLNSRRGQIRGAETRDALQVVSAFAPLANMFGYGSTLRAFSEGRASFTMQYDHYAPVPLPNDEPPTFSPAIGMRA